MARNLLDVAAGSTLVIDFNTVDPETLVPFTLAGSPAVGVWKDGAKMTLTTAPDLYVDKEDASSGAAAKTGSHWITIDLLNDDSEYTAGSDYVVKLTAGTVNGYSVADQTVATFSIANRETVLRDDSFTIDKVATGLFSTDEQLATTFWGALLSGNSASGSFGELLNNLVDNVVKKFGVPLTVAGTPTTTSIDVESAESLTNTQIDNALLLHLDTGRYTRITDITGTTITVSPALPSAPVAGQELVVFGKYLASL